MWEIIIKEVSGGSSHTIIENSIPLTFGQVISNWQYNEEFRAFFIDVLIKNDFIAYRWETPPISKSLINRVFEFVLLNSPDLDRNQNDRAFRQYLNTANEDIISFSNLGKDATLIVPCNKNKHTNYCHLAAFLRTATEKQKHSLWIHVGKSVAGNLGEMKKWLSTAGAGVPWLHVRFDSIPKYYSYQKYINDT